jgi:hypothetical protein
MPPSNAVIRLSREELSELEDLTDKLCNLTTVLLYHISLLPTDDLPAPLFERMMIITGIVAKTDDSLRKLLFIWVMLQRSEARRMKCSGETEDEKGCSKPPQGC